MRNLLEDHVGRVYHFALRLSGDHHVAEDIAQEAILKAWQRRKQLREVRALRVWLFKIAANLWHDHLRRSNRGSRTVHPLPETLCSGKRSSAEELSQREDVERALCAIDSLPRRQREVLWLHAIEEFTYEEIATVLDTSTNAVKVSLCEARSTLRKRLRRHES